MKHLGILLAVAIAIAIASAGRAAGKVERKVGWTLPKGDGDVHLHDSNGGSVRYLSGDRAFKAFKPYVSELLSPKGVNPLLDSPADHIHHHGLMYAVAIDGIDFWSENAKCGKQVPRFEMDWDDEVSTGINWVSHDGKTVVAKESRGIRMIDANGATTMVWQTRLRPPPGKESIKITGSHYFGLGMRFVRSMDNASTFTFADPNAKSEKVRGDERLTRSKWAACIGKVDGNTVTVAMFDHPDNARPVLWFTMSKPFSYLSATLNLHRKPMVVKSGDKLDVRYGVAIWDGKPGRDEIAAAHKRWLKRLQDLKAEPKKTIQLIPGS